MEGKLNIQNNNYFSLYNNNSDCCGCGACMNECPTNAICMKEDEYGFLYPYINFNLCIKCGACKKACGYQKITEKNYPKEVYASAMKNHKKILNSASGGIFEVFANSILSNSGIVFGASMEIINDTLTPMHISINKLEDLPKLQGSKYVQSMIGNTYKEVKRYLINGKQVLFSGTPCQIAGLRFFLKKHYDNLLTIDLICHGVPNAKFFNDYINFLDKKINGKIIDFKFRDKDKGWGYNGKIIYKTKSNIIKEKYIQYNTSSYYKMFSDSEICRNSCYLCKYASLNRIGDITIGDYWGIQEEHPELMKENGGVFNDKFGISCLMINTKKGKEYLNKCKSELDIYPSTLEKVAKHNEQLNIPCHKSNDRETILNLYHINGYKEVEKYFIKRLGIKYFYFILLDIIPKRLKKIIKRILHL